MKDWKRFIDTFTPANGYRDELAGLRAVQLAALAAELGTFSVGAVLLDDQGETIIEGYNESFLPNFRSDRHAEMVVINRFESELQSAYKPASLTLVSSLEPCPMCTARLIYAGIGTIRYVCPDPTGGMVSRRDFLPPKILEISRDLAQSWELAECSDELRDAAANIWEQTRDKVDQRIVDHGLLHLASHQPKV